MDVAAWLQGLGLERYAPAFRDNDVDAEVLLRLTTEDLRELGVASIGHRRRLLDAIVALGAGVTAAPRDAPAEAEAERRQLTVMFCDLVGSTALSTRHDPEDLRELIGDYHRAIADTVGRFDGFVAKYMGDGVLIYFGYPQAHEDDAERAVRAGLAVIAAVGRLPAREDLRVRLGIATGLAVVGDLIGEGAAQERGVVGETPNLAARLQALAAPNTLVIAEATRRQVGGLFDLADLGPQALAGFAEPQPAWRVIGESGVLSRFEALRSGETPLVGRDEEVELLLRRWQQAKSGEGRVVLISGEPGIGKSRLTAALSEHIEPEPHTRLRYFCSPHYQDSALYPLIVQLERAAGFARDDGPETKLDKLATLLAPAAEAGEISLLVELLSLPGGDRFTPIELSPQRKKERTLAALLRQLEGLARQQPVLMIFEDLHWIDPTSREFLDLVLARIDRLPVLLVATFRPEFQPPWTGQPHVTVMSLNRLGRGDGAAMVEQLAGNVALLPPDVIAEIVERTDGVPLFVEEMTKAVLEAGAERGLEIAASVPGAGLGVPATLQASLMARLDRLGPAAKGVAQIGAAIGREFSYELVVSVSELAEERFQDALQRLVDAGLVFQRGAPSTAKYLFKHALVQEAAYGTLLRRTRRQLHARIASSLESLSPELIDTQPELFAQHYGEAGLVEKSVTFWGKAGRRSAARSAMAEAAAQLQKGLDQLAMLPDSPERRLQELEFYSALGAALLAVKGQAASETGRVYALALRLWEQLGSPSEFVHLLWGQSTHHAHRGELDLALHLEEDLLRLSHKRNDSGGLVLGHASSGRTLMFAARFASSRSHSEKALALYDPTSHRPLVRQLGFHPHVSSRAYLGIALLCLGFPDQALAQSNAAITEARRLAHPTSLAVSLTLGALPLWLVGDNAALGKRAAELVAVATEQGFALWGAQGTIYRGWVKVEKGDVTEGISLLRSGASAYRATGAMLLNAYYNTLLARACEIAGQVEEGLTLLDEALQIVERTEERWFTAELNRHKGRLLLRQGRSEAAEELYRQALRIAEEQGAKLWELRAAASLAWLRRDQGREAEARDLLAPVYGWFTEGFDTPDLKEAKALLDELA
jgi:class 3 adenylate cyclase/predicted ATPase/energy-coupling factor transporter ATP-binding protein EcfA2